MSGGPDYERRMADWVARQLEIAPPLTEEQKSVVRTAFAAHRREQAGAA